MAKRITLICTLVAAGSLVQAQQSGSSNAQPQTLLSRLRGDNSSAQQIQERPREIAQPAPNQQGYRPGVTFPQGAQQQQPSAPPPGYPAPVQTLPYGMQPGGPQPGAAPNQAPPRPTQTPSRSRSSSSDDSNDQKSSSKSSSSSSRSSKSSSSDADKSEDSTSDKKTSANSSKKTEAVESEKKSADADAPKKESSSNSSSALEKIVKKVESGNKTEDQANEKAAEVKKTKEEIEAAKAREAALKEADRATTAVARFLTQANDGLYSKATEHLAPAIKKYFDSEISAINGTQKSVLDELTGNGNISMVTYVNTTVRGEGAVVEVELSYQDGRTTRRSFDLIQLEGEWKIVLPVTDASIAKHKEASSASAAPAPSAIPAAATPAPAAPPAVPTAEQAAASAPPMVTAPPSAPADGTTTPAR